MASFTRSVAYPWALTGVFGAIQIVVTIIPYSIAIGGGGVISFGLVSGAIIGFLLGPFFGTIAVLIGSFAGGIVNPSIALFGPLTALAPATGAFVAGSFRVREIRIKPVPLVLILYVLALCSFILYPIGSLAPGFLEPDIITALLVLLLSVPSVGRQLSDALPMKPVALVRIVYILALCSFILYPIGGLTPRFLWLHIIASLLVLLFSVPSVGRQLSDALPIKPVPLVLIVYIIALCFFILGPIGSLAPGFLWLHIIAGLLVLLFLVPGVGHQLSDAVLEPDSEKSLSFFAIWLVSFIAVMADHLVGSTIATYVFSAGMDPEPLALLFMGVAFIYPWERLLASVITAVVLYVTSISLAKTYFDLPTLPGIPSAPLEIPPEELEKLSG